MEKTYKGFIYYVCRGSLHLPVDKWYDVIGESTVADAILDILLFSGYRYHTASLISGDSDTYGCLNT